VKKKKKKAIAPRGKKKKGTSVIEEGRAKELKKGRQGNGCLSQKEMLFFEKLDMAGKMGEQERWKKHRILRGKDVRFRKKRCWRKNDGGAGEEADMSEKTPFNPP